MVIAWVYYSTYNNHCKKGYHTIWKCGRGRCFFLFEKRNPWNCPSLLRSRVEKTFLKEHSVCSNHVGFRFFSNEIKVSKNCPKNRYNWFISGVVNELVWTDVRNTEFIGETLYLDTENSAKSANESTPWWYSISPSSIYRSLCVLKTLNEVITDFVMITISIFFSICTTVTLFYSKIWSLFKPELVWPVLTVTKS